LQYLNAKTAADAFKALCSSRGLIVPQEGANVLLVFDTSDHIDRVVQQIRQVDQAGPGLQVESINLRFLQATDMLTIVQKMVSSAGQVAANQSNNCLIVCDSLENIRRIIAEIRKADQAPPQVLVEVVLLDVQLSNDAEIGFNWDYLRRAPDDVGYRQNFTTNRLRMVEDSEDMASKGIAFNTVGLGGEVSIVTGTVRALVHAIQQRQKANVIASPRAMVVSGKKAIIKAVEEIPYIIVTDSAAGGQLQQTEFKEVGVTLEVTATVTDSNQIFLDARTVQNVQTGVSVAGVPVVDTRESQTNLLLNDGQIVIMGGLRRQVRIRQKDQIPVLGDIPVLGALFRGVIDKTYSSELVVLLSPHIYKGQPVPADIMEKVEKSKDSLISGPKGSDDRYKGSLD
jgi:type II secretory pathway component GspD/PulD (secretin)